MIAIINFLNRINLLKLRVRAEKHIFLYKIKELTS